MESYLDERGRPRVVVTGLGAMTPVGNSPAESWRNVVAGNSGIRRISLFDASDFPVSIAGEVKDFDPAKYMDFKEARRMARCSQLTVAAARQALADAGLEDGLPDSERTGVLVGTGMGGFERADEGMRNFRAKGLARVNPFGLVSALPNMPSHYVSLISGARGPISTVVSACATGTQAVGEAAEMIRRGAADIVISGGAEGLVHEGSLAGFLAMRALSMRFNDQPERACRPFDLDRDGFILGEGAAILVLERLEHALARGAKIYAEMRGHASSSDAFHVASPDPQGEGAVRAMRWAMQDAGVNPDEIDYINAHGTGTVVNDATETLAIKQLFGEQAYNIPVSSTKSVTGHGMGAAGAMEAIFCIQAMNEGVMPPTVNYETPDPACDLDYVPNEARPADLNVVLSNSFGLGGQNACVVLGKYDNGRPVEARPGGGAG